jgi:hypothetical protein
VIVRSQYNAIDFTTVYKQQFLNKLEKKIRKLCKISGAWFLPHLMQKKFMNSTSGKKSKEKKETPIIDGDARPDTPDSENSAAKKSSPVGNSKNVTSNRTGDVNSLEDYKDTKS